tara:strand:+ start:10386 stop:12665 length:2280 start_codon:yes stop_codon:yes gene_type:complete
VETLNRIKSKFAIIIQESGYRGLFKRVKNRICRFLNQFYKKFIDYYFCTYPQNIDCLGLSDKKININYKVYPKHIIPKNILTHYIAHRFDLLGSGWRQIYYDMKCQGLMGYQYFTNSDIRVDKDGIWLKNQINHSNIVSAQKIWKQIDSDYKPIDWQLDFKSGYRWSEKTWYKDIQYGHQRGVDIKVPWELARMQHLPQMALECLVLSDNSKQKNLLKNEFRNQILDFIATNPPRYGVNWVCTMDVAIRVSNWLLAYDIMTSSGIKFDSEFKNIFVESIYSHGIHIISNLEWNNNRGNHYLANIAGLVFVSTYLSSSSETDAWLTFAIQELINEVDRQFYPDGTNFEGSTSYHRLSAEMVLFSTALLLGLTKKRQQKLKGYNCNKLKIGNKNPVFKEGPLPMYEFPNNKGLQNGLTPFPPWYFERIERMVEFVLDISKPSGHIPQIGDNDSGRFFKLKPEYEVKTTKETKDTYTNLFGYNEMLDGEIYFLEDHLNARHIIISGFALFNRDDFANSLGGHEEAVKSPDYYIIKAMMGNANLNLKQLDNRKGKPSLYCRPNSEDHFKKLVKKLEYKSNNVLVYRCGNSNLDIPNNLKIKSYPDFGLFLYKSNEFYLTVRCWPGEKPFIAGHMHLDQFSIELIMGNKVFISDPGSYIYTPLPDYRNQYRSAEAHFTPFLTSQNQLDLMENDCFCPIVPIPFKPTYFGPKGFLVEGDKNYPFNYYLVQLKKDKIKIYFSGFDRDHLTPLNRLSRSIGYGILLK